MLLKSFVVISLLLNVSSEGTILSRLLGLGRSSSSVLPQPVITMISCNNNSETNPSGAKASSNYFLPTILNYAPSKSHTSASSDENGIDIGNRISSPISSFSSWPTGTRLGIHSNRLTSNQNFNQIDQVEKAMDVENDVKFYLFTKENSHLAHELKVNQKQLLNSSNFSPNRPTKFIFHGFTDVDASGEWVNVMKETYLSAKDMNIIVADFSTFSLHNLVRSSLPMFASKRLSEFIAFLQTETGSEFDSFHVIARSYACHIVGLTGRLLKGQLGRITALEPSKMFTSGSQEVKLSKEDALFVDVIHVNGQRFFFHGQQFGLTSPMGNVDIYPSFTEKGLGCPGENVNFRRYSTRFCNLGRGVRYFTNTIKYAQLYPMCECSSFEIYKAGLCSCNQESMISYMGEYISNETQGVFQLVPQQTPFSFSSFPNTYLLGF